MFNIFLTMHLRIILVCNQLDAQFLLWYVYLNPLHVSSNYVLILRRTIVGIQHLVQSLCVSSRPVYRTATNAEWLCNAIAPQDLGQCYDNTLSKSVFIQPRTRRIEGLIQLQLPFKQFWMWLFLSHSKWDVTNRKV